MTLGSEFSRLIMSYTVFFSSTNSVTPVGKNVSYRGCLYKCSQTTGMPPFSLPFTALWVIPPSKLLRCVTLSTCLLQILTHASSILSWPTNKGIQLSWQFSDRLLHPTWGNFILYVFFFLISQNLCVLPMVQFFFFHMKFRFSILWKNNIGVSWDEFPSNNGFNIKHLSIVAKKKS